MATRRQTIQTRIGQTPVGQTKPDEAVLYQNNLYQNSLEQSRTCKNHPIQTQTRNHTAIHTVSEHPISRPTDG